jgi:hypothetical protein
MTSELLRRALADTGPLGLLPLPERAAELLEQLDAPPRLAAHLRVVHDVAHRLVEWAWQNYPEVTVDRAAVLFGAATHDLGKCLHPAELSGPGSAHEQAGYELLLSYGTDPRLARFARTHALWGWADVDMDDLLVSLADKVWKAKRVPDLEQMVVDKLVEATGQERWQAFLALDEELTSIAEDAGRRLAFQTGYAIAT